MLLNGHSPQVIAENIRTLKAAGHDEATALKHAHAHAAANRAAHGEKASGRLTSADRHALPAKDFALPGERYPIEDKSHARNALSRVSGNGTPAEKAEVRAAVHQKYPSIGQS